MEGRIQEIATDPGAEKNYKVDLRGGYIVIETNQGMNFMWDQKTTVVVHVAPSFQVSRGWTGSYDFKVRVTHPEVEPQFFQGLEKKAWKRFGLVDTKKQQAGHILCFIALFSQYKTLQNIWG